MAWNSIFGLLGDRDYTTDRKPLAMHKKETAYPFALSIWKNKEPVLNLLVPSYLLAALPVLHPMHDAISYLSEYFRLTFSYSSVTVPCSYFPLGT